MKRLFSLSLAFLLLCGLLVLVAAGCGVLQSLSSLGSGGAGKCSLDVTSVKSIHEFDFQDELGLPEDAAQKLEGVLVAIAELQGFVASVDRDLGAACAEIAQDLGAPPVPPPLPDAGAPVGSAIERSCTDAAARIKDALAAVVTEKTTVTLDVGLPHCSLDLHATASCAAECDDGFDPKVPIGCEPGKLLADGKCGGELKLPDMSSECEAKCSVEANASASCTPPKVTLKIEGGADPQKIEHLRAALERGLSRVIHVAVSVGQRAVKLAGNVRGIAQDIKSSVEALVKKMSSPTEAAKRGAKVASCLGPAFLGVVETALKIKLDVASAVALKDKALGAVKQAAADARAKAEGAVKDARDKVEGAVKDALDAGVGATIQVLQNAEDAATRALTPTSPK